MRTPPHDEPNSAASAGRPCTSGLLYFYTIANAAAVPLLPAPEDTWRRHWRLLLYVCTLFRRVYTTAAVSNVRLH